MPAIPKYMASYARQHGPDAAINALIMLQRQDGREGDLPNPLQFAQYLREFVYMGHQITGWPLGEEQVRVISRQWWEYLAKTFDLPDHAANRIMLEQRCIAPLAEEGLITRAPKTSVTRSTEGRKKLAEWLKRTYFIDEPRSKKAVVLDKVGELMKDFVASLEIMEFENEIEEQAA